MTHQIELDGRAAPQTRGEQTAMAIEITVPTLGESVADATVARWIKKTGDAVAADEPVVELETDKVTLEVPAPAAGTLGEILAAEGATVEVGASLAMLNEGAAARCGACRRPGRDACRHSCTCCASAGRRSRSRHCRRRLPRHPIFHCRRRYAVWSRNMG